MHFEFNGVVTVIDDQIQLFKVVLLCDRSACILVHYTGCNESVSVTEERERERVKTTGGNDMSPPSLSLSLPQTAPPPADVTLVC